MPTLLDLIQARPHCRRRRMRRRGQHGLHFTCCAPLRWTGCAWYCRECGK